MSPVKLYIIKNKICSSSDANKIEQSSFPVSKMENYCMDGVEVSWITGITFSKRGSGVTNWLNIILEAQL